VAQLVSNVEMPQRIAYNRKSIFGSGASILKRVQAIFSAYWGSLVVLVLTTLLTIGALTWMGYDLNLLGRAYIGNGGDTYATSWFLHQGYENLTKRPFDLGYATDFYGEAAPFAFTIAPYGLSLITFPLFWLTGGNLVLTYNLYWILTFPLTAWAMYLLVRYLVHTPRNAAILIGLMVAFAQWRFLHISQIELLSMYLYLLTLYCFHRLLDTPRRIWTIALIGLLSLTLFTVAYYAIQFSVIAVIVAMFAIHGRRMPFTLMVRRQLLIAACLSAVIGLGLISFRFSNPSFRGGFHFYDIANGIPEDWIRGNSQLYYGYLPYREEGVLFLGFTPLVLAILGWYYRRVEPHSEPETQAVVNPPRAFSTMQIVSLYAILTVVGYILTLGPTLKLSPTLEIPLPYAILYQIPMFGLMHITTVFIVMAIFGTAILAGHMFRLLYHSKAPAYYLLYLLGIGLSLLIELVPFNGNPDHHVLALPQPEMHTLRPTPVDQVPPVYLWLKSQPPGTPVFHYPNKPDSIFTYLLWEYVHDQPMLNGYGSFRPQWYATMNWDQFPSPEIMQVLLSRHIKYVLIHHELMTPDDETHFQTQLVQSGYAPNFNFVGTYGSVDVYAISETRDF
jgi:hypothetical protein